MCSTTQEEGPDFLGEGPDFLGQGEGVANPQGKTDREAISKKMQATKPASVSPCPWLKEQTPHRVE